LTNPAVDLHDLPRIDLVLLSHYHEDHFDKKVEDSLRRDLPIITTPHGREHLTSSDRGFTQVHALDTWQSMWINIASKTARIKVTAMPGKHVPGHVEEALKDIAGAIPPTAGWMLELSYSTIENFKSGYTIYITGDTLFVSELEDIPKRYPNVDLLLIHLGGTTISEPNLPLLMVTMDHIQGSKVVHLINPDVTIPIHYDDYDVFKSPLEDFKKEMEKTLEKHKVVYLDRGDEYKFNIRPLNPQ